MGCCLLILSAGPTSCGQDVGLSASPKALGDAVVKTSGALSTCSLINKVALFNAGSGTDRDPYIICDEQQFLNISLAEINDRPSLNTPGTYNFSNMGKSYKLGRNLNFAESSVEFFSLGHFMASVGRSPVISASDKYLIATNDKRNLTNAVRDLSSQRIPFNGKFDGNGNTIVIGDYVPTESRLVGLFSVVAPGAVIKNFTLKDFHIYTKGGVNIGLVAGSTIQTPLTKFWKDYGIIGTKRTVTFDSISIENSSMYDVVGNSGALSGVLRSYPGEEVIVKNINISNVFIDGAIETSFDPAYGDETLQAFPIVNQMHNVGILAGYAQFDGKASFSNIAVKSSDVSLEGFYTGEWREEDIGDIDYINNSFLADVDFIYDGFDDSLLDHYNPADPAHSVGTVFGGFVTSSNLAKVSVNNVTVNNSSASFYEVVKAAGNFAGSLGLLGGDVSFNSISMSENTIEFGMNEWSLPSSGIGTMAGVLTLGSSGSKYTFSKISVDAQITGKHAATSGEISGFFGLVNALDEVMLKDNKISFSEISISGGATLGGLDIHTLGSFAGSLTADGDSSGASPGKNNISFSSVFNNFFMSTPDNYAMMIGGFAGYLGRGNYVLDKVVVESSIDTFNDHNFYDYVNTVIGFFNSQAVVSITNSSYLPLRPEFSSGIPEEKDQFVKL